jgi:hypothetical protein
MLASTFASFGETAPRRPRHTPQNSIATGPRPASRDLITTRTVNMLSLTEDNDVYGLTKEFSAFADPAPRSRKGAPLMPAPRLNGRVFP